MAFDGKGITFPFRSRLARIAMSTLVVFALCMHAASGETQSVQVSASSCEQCGAAPYMASDNMAMPCASAQPFNPPATGGVRRGRWKKRRQDLCCACALRGPDDDSDDDTNMFLPRDDPGRLTLQNGICATYFKNSKLDDDGQTVKKVDTTLNFNWENNAPIPGWSLDGFSVRWEGVLRPEVSGTYQFFLESNDGSRMWLDGNEIIDKWADGFAVGESKPQTLVAGKSHVVRFEFYETKGGARFRVMWAGPGMMDRENIPRRLLILTEPCDSNTNSLGRDRLPGLCATYYQNPGLVGTGRASETDVVSRVNLKKAPFPGVADYSARWEGELKVERPGTYTFYIESDGGSRLWVDGKLVIADMKSHRLGLQSGDINLPGYKSVDIRLEYSSDPGAVLNTARRSLLQLSNSVGDEDRDEDAEVEGGMMDIAPISLLQTDGWTGPVIASEEAGEVDMSNGWIAAVGAEDLLEAESDLELQKKKKKKHKKKKKDKKKKKQKKKKGKVKKFLGKLFSKKKNKNGKKYGRGNRKNRQYAPSGHRSKKQKRKIFKRKASRGKKKQGRRARVAKSQSAPGKCIGDAVVEVGTVKASHKPVTVKIVNDFKVPIVFTTVGYRGPNPGIARVDSVNRDSFVTYVSEPKPNDGPHASEDVDYIVVEKGGHQTDDGKDVLAGTIDLKSGQSSHVSFSDPSVKFSQPPAVLVQVQEVDAPRWRNARVTKVSGNGFTVTLDDYGPAKGSPDASANNKGGATTVGWVAFEVGDGQWEGSRYKFNLQTFSKPSANMRVNGGMSITGLSLVDDENPYDHVRSVSDSVATVRQINGKVATNPNLKLSVVSFSKAFADCQGTRSSPGSTGSSTVSNVSSRNNNNNNNNNNGNGAYRGGGRVQPLARDSVVRLHWSGPGMAGRELIPARNLIHPVTMCQPRSGDDSEDDDDNDNNDNTSASNDGLCGTYFANKDLKEDGKSRQRGDKTIDFDWAGGSPGVSGIGGDFFSIRWEGKIRGDGTGDHTFWTQTDDGARLWVNGELLVDDWKEHPPTFRKAKKPIRLENGKWYDVTMEFFERQGGAFAKLYWQSPNHKNRQIIPSSFMSYSGPCNGVGNSGSNGPTRVPRKKKTKVPRKKKTKKPKGKPAQRVSKLRKVKHVGLCGTYFANKDLKDDGKTKHRADKKVDFDWHGNNPGVKGIPQDNFSIRWVGKVKADGDGPHTFWTQTDDGGRLWVNGELIVDDWKEHPPQFAKAKKAVNLKKGKWYDIKMEFFEHGGGAFAKLLWETPKHKKRRVIDHHHLKHVGKCGGGGRKKLELLGITNAGSVEAPVSSSPLVATDGGDGGDGGDDGGDDSDDDSNDDDAGAASANAPDAATDGGADGGADDGGADDSGDDDNEESDMTKADDGQSGDDSGDDSDDDSDADNTATAATAEDVPDALQSDETVDTPDATTDGGDSGADDDSGDDSDDDANVDDNKSDAVADRSSDGNDDSDDDSGDDSDNGDEDTTDEADVAPPDPSTATVTSTSTPSPSSAQPTTQSVTSTSSSQSTTTQPISGSPTPTDPSVTSSAVVSPIKPATTPTATSTAPAATTPPASAATTPPASAATTPPASAATTPPASVATVPEPHPTSVAHASEEAVAMMRGEKTHRIPLPPPATNGTASASSPSPSPLPPPPPPRSGETAGAVSTPPTTAPAHTPAPAQPMVQPSPNAIDLKWSDAAFLPNYNGLPSVLEASSDGAGRSAMKFRFHHPANVGVVSENPMAHFGVGTVEAYGVKNAQLDVVFSARRSSEPTPAGPTPSSPPEEVGARQSVPLELWLWKNSDSFVVFRFQTSGASDGPGLFSVEVPGLPPVPATVVPSLVNQDMKLSLKAEGSTGVKLSLHDGDKLIVEEDVPLGFDPFLWTKVCLTGNAPQYETWVYETKLTGQVMSQSI